MSEQSNRRPWSGGRARSEGEDGDIRTNLCGFEGAKPELRAEAREEVSQAVRLPTDVNRKAEARVMERTAFHAAAKGLGPCQISGDNSLRDPPVPIPNTEVKPQHADSTWLETAR